MEISNPNIFPQLRNHQRIAIQSSIENDFLPVFTIMLLELENHGLPCIYYSNFIKKILRLM